MKLWAQFSRLTGYSTGNVLMKNFIWEKKLLECLGTVLLKTSTVRFRTAINVLGDSLGAGLVAHLSREEVALAREQEEDDKSARRYKMTK